jgi:DNA polymerase-3 subunit chi
MTEILFYHLTESTLEKALPELLEKSLERGWNVVVQTGGEERRDALDNHLWTFRDDSFLAHGVDSEKQPDDQPVFLTVTETNPNNAAIRFFVDGASPGDISAYERVVVMFDGHDEEQLAQARLQWKKWKDDGGKLTYWQQTSEGGWKRQS